MAKDTVSSQAFKSAETVSDSDTGSDASSGTSGSSSQIKRKLPSKAADTPSKRVKFSDTNETKSITASEATSEDSGSEDESEEGDDNDSSGGGSTNDTNSSSEGEEDGDSNESGPLQTNGHSPNPSSLNASPSLSKLTYAPPSGFTKVKQISNSTVHASMFRPPSLDGKQLWHFTAPASVPLTELRSLTADQIRAGSTILSHDGAQYELAHSEEGRDARLLVADENGIYKQVKAEIVQHLSLKHTVSLPETALFPDDRPPADAPAINVHDVRPAKVQPEGLRTRWWPTGFEDKHRFTANGAAAKRSSKKPRHAKEEDSPRKKHKKDKERSEKHKRRKSTGKDVVMED